MAVTHAASPFAHHGTKAGVHRLLDWNTRSHHLARHGSLPMRKRRVIVTLIVVVAPTSGATSSDDPTRTESQRQPCTIAVARSQRISLRDGASVTIDASGIATNGQSVMVVGTPTHVWPVGAKRNTPRATARPSIGIVRDSSGLVTLVPAPLRALAAAHPRVASAGAAGWHFIFVTGKQGSATNALVFDSADVWYGNFDGRAWRGIERIGRARSASLLPGMGSDLVSTPEGLAFAYPFDRSASLKSNATGNQGLVMLYRRGRHWVADTLHTWEGPRSVQLVASAENGVLAVFAQSYFTHGRPHGPALFTARYDSGWHSPRLAVDVSPRYVAAPMIVARGTAGHVISWRTAAPGAEAEVIEWGLSDDSGSVRRVGPISNALPLDRPAMVRLSADQTAWFIRNGNSRSEVKAFMAVDSTLSDLGVVRLPLDNFATLGATLPNGDVLLVTGGLGSSASAPVASNFLTALAVRCPVARE